MFIFGLRSTSDDRLGWSMDSNPICHLQPKKKMLIFGLHSTSYEGWSKDLKPCLSNQKNEMLIFGLCSTLMKSSKKNHFWITFKIGRAGQYFNPIRHPSPAKKMKCSFLDHVQLLMICRAGHGLQPKKFHFWIMFNFWWSAEDLSKKCQPKCKKTQKRPPKSSKNKMFIFGLHSTSDDRPSDLSKKCQLKGKKTKKAP